MSGTKSSQGGLTRRNFLKTTAAVAGATALAGGASLTALADGDLSASAGAQIEEKYLTCRGNCFGGCRFKMTVKDGVVTKSEMASYPGDDRYDRMCSKGLTHAQRTYSPDRIQYPMRRVEGTERGAGQWERITWDEAIAEIGAKWREYIADYGPSSIAYTTCSGNYQGQGRQYIEGMGMTLGFTWLDMYVDAAGGYAMPAMVGYCAQEVTDLVNAKNVFFVLGVNPALSMIQHTSFIWEMKKKGGKVIAVDPNINISTARLADDCYTIRPATDACFYMGMCHAVIEEGLTDVEFLQTRTVAPFLVKKSDGLFLRKEDLSGTLDPAALSYDAFLVMGEDGSFGLPSEVANPVLEGTFTIGDHEVTTAYTLLLERLGEYPMELCAEVCGISEDRIREAARIYADGPTTALHAYGADHYTNGHTGYMAIVTLAALTGNFFKNGAVVGQSLVAAGINMGYGWMGQVAQTVGPQALPAEPQVKFGPNVLREVVESSTINGIPVKADGSYRLKSWYIAMSNPVGSSVNRRDTLAAIEKIDLIVVQDVVWSESACHADYVLPASYYTEYEDFSNGIAFSAPWVSITEKCVEPVFDTKIDFDIFNSLVNEIGRSEVACSSWDEWKSYILDSSQLAQMFGFNLDSLREEKARRIYHNFVDGGPILATCDTMTGRINLYLETPTSNYAYPGEYDVDRERMVYWEPPRVAWPETIAGFEMSEEAKKFPLSMHWKRSRFSTHTTYGIGSHWLEEVEPEPYIRMNPDDAEARGVVDGDMVKVYNDNGYCVIRAHVDAGLRPGCIDTPQRWQGSQYVEGSMCDLPSQVYHPFVLNCCFNECQVEIEKL